MLTCACAVAQVAYLTSRSHINVLHTKRCFVKLDEPHTCVYQCWKSRFGTHSIPKWASFSDLVRQSRVLLVTRREKVERHARRRRAQTQPIHYRKTKVARRVADQVCHRRKDIFSIKIYPPTHHTRTPCCPCHATFRQFPAHFCLAPLHFRSLMSRVTGLMNCPPGQELQKSSCGQWHRRANEICADSISTEPFTVTTSACTIVHVVH